MSIYNEKQKRNLAHARSMASMGQAELEEILERAKPENQATASEIMEQQSQHSTYSFTIPDLVKHTLLQQNGWGPVNYKLPDNAVLLKKVQLGH